MGDSLVGLEARNTTNIADKTIVMYAKFRPVTGSFGLYFRDGNNEARNAAEIFKVSFSNTGIRYSTTTTTNGSANGTVSDASMTAWQTTLDRSRYYEVWLLDTPVSSGANMGHNVAAYVRFTNANGQEVNYSISRRQTSAAASTMNFPTFALYEGNLTATVNIEEFSVYTLNTASPLITYNVSGEGELERPTIGGSVNLQLSAGVIHTANDRLPVPNVLPNAKWEILGQDSLQGVSIDQNGLVTLTGDFVDDYFDVMVSNADSSSPWAPTIKRVIVLKPAEITKVTVDKPEFTYGVPAEIKVSVEGLNLGNRKITVDLFGKTAEAVNGIASFNFAAADIPLPKTYSVTASTASGVSNTSKVSVLGKALVTDAGTGKTTAYFNIANGELSNCILAEYDSSGKMVYSAVQNPVLQDGYWFAEMSRVAANGGTIKAFAWDAQFVPIY
jgi:hypothetical protein